MIMPIKVGPMLLVILLLPLAARGEELPTWAFEVEAMLRTIPQGVVDWSKVDDPDASAQRAVVVNRKTGNIAYWHNFVVLPPGEYVAVFRLKVSDNTTHSQVFDLQVENVAARLVVRADEFRAPNVYQDFELPFKLTRPASINTPIRGTVVDGQSAWADSVTITTLRSYGDDQQQRLLGLAAHDAFELPAASAGICFVKGLYHEMWSVPTALGEPRQASTVYAAPLGPQVRDFPPTLAELGTYRLLILANIPAGALTIELRTNLEQYVRSGGGLIVLGGPYSFGLGDYDQSDILRRLLPVEIDKHYDLVKCDPPQTLDISADWATGLTSLRSNSPVVLYRHRLAPKAGAKMFASAGGEPLIVGGRFGKGRVAVVLATPLGIAPDGRVPWWESPAWPEILARLGLWTLGTPAQDN
jgi:uncharacterized membrane protein